MVFFVLHILTPVFFFIFHDHDDLVTYSSGAYFYSFLGGLDKHIITGLEVNSNQDPECEGVPVFKFAGKQVCATLG